MTRHFNIYYVSKKHYLVEWIFSTVAVKSVGKTLQGMINRIQLCHVTSGIIALNHQTDLIPLTNKSASLISRMEFPYLRESKGACSKKNRLNITV